MRMVSACASDGHLLGIRWDLTKSNIVGKLVLIAHLAASGIVVCRWAIADRKSLFPWSIFSCVLRCTWMMRWGAIPESACDGKVPILDVITWTVLHPDDGDVVFFYSSFCTRAYISCGLPFGNMKRSITSMLHISFILNGGCWPFFEWTGIQMNEGYKGDGFQCC